MWNVVDARRTRTKLIQIHTFTYQLDTAMFFWCVVGAFSIELHGNNDKRYITSASLKNVRQGKPNQTNHVAHSFISYINFDFYTIISIHQLAHDIISHRS